MRSRYNWMKKTWIEGHVAQQLLKVEEEASVVRYCLLVDNLGFPLAYEMAQEIAKDLYQKS